MVEECTVVYTVQQDPATVTLHLVPEGTGLILFLIRPREATKNWIRFKRVSPIDYSQTDIDLGM